MRSKNMIRTIGIFSFILLIVLSAPAFATTTATGVALDQARILAATTRTVVNAYWGDFTDQLRAGATPRWKAFNALGITLPAGITVDGSGAAGNSGDSFIYIGINSGFASSNVLDMALSFLPLAVIEGGRIKVPLVRPGADLSGINLDFSDYVRRDAMGRDGTTNTPTFDAGRSVRLGAGSQLIFQSNGKIEFTDGLGQINNVYSIGQAGRSYIYFDNGTVRIGSAGTPSNLQLASGTLLGANATLSGNLNVGGVLTASTLSITNGLTVNGLFTTQNLTVPGNLTVRGNMVLQGANVAQVRSLNITGSAALPQALTIGGKTGNSSAQAYSKWVTNAVRAETARSGVLKFSDDAREFSTLTQLRNAVAAWLTGNGYIEKSSASSSTSSSLNLFDEVEKEKKRKSASSNDDDVFMPIPRIALRPGDSNVFSDAIAVLKETIPEENIKGIEVELFARGGTLSWEDLGKVKSGSAPVEERKTLRLDDLKPRTISFTPLFPDGEGEVRIIGIWVDEKYAQ